MKILKFETDQFKKIIKEDKSIRVDVNISSDNNTLTVNNLLTIMNNSNNKKTIDYLINNCDLDEDNKFFFNYIKYTFLSYYLEYDLCDVYKKIYNFLKRLCNSNLYIFGIDCLLYNMSYMDVNHKDILTLYYSIFNKLFIKDKIVNRKVNKKIKILFIAFYLILPNGNVTSVFRDRAEIIKRLNSNIFEKHLIIVENTGNNNRINSLISSVDNVIKIKSLKIDNIFYNFINNIRSSNFDIVIYPSIGMHYYNIQFALNRLAPIQINTWGHSITSGIDTIDYYISSKLYEIDDLEKAQKNYSEKLLALNNLTTYYTCNGNYDSYYSKDELSLPKDKYILFCMYNLLKLNKQFYDILIKILKIIPNSMILLCKENLNNEKQKYINDLLLNKVIFVETCDHKTYNSYLYHSDIVLDTYPFGGCNSSLEAFAKGKIIITRPSNKLPGRFTYGFYKKMGIMDVVVDNYDEYVEKAVYYLTNKEAKKKLEEKILGKKDLLFNDEESVKEWQDTLINLYKEKINPEFDETIQYVEPIKLLNFNRFDIIFKYIFIKYTLIYKTFDNWSLNLYKEHIQLLNGGYEMKTIYQKDVKNSVAEFVESFKQLINSFINNGFRDEKIPVNGDIIQNGSHRTACYLYFNRRVPVDLIENDKKWVCNPIYFTNRLKHQRVLPYPYGKEMINKINDKYLDTALLEYIKLKIDNVRIMCILSDDYKTHKRKIEEFIKLVDVTCLYEKYIKLNTIGMKNLIRQFYLTETFVNVDAKCTACFGSSDIAYITVLVLESNNMESLSKFSSSGGEYKNHIRKMFGNHHALHVTDNNNDTDRVAKLFFNKNTIDFYNKIDQKYSENMDKNFKEYTSKISGSSYNSDNYCIVSSFILGLHNLREPNNDIDYIHNDKELDDIVSHNINDKIYYESGLKDIIYNPDNYFYYNSYKCCTLNIVKKMKERRNQIPKDIDDIKLISGNIDNISSVNQRLTVLVLTNKTDKSLKCLELTLLNLKNNLTELKEYSTIICHDVNEKDTSDYYDQLNQLIKKFKNTELIMGDKKFIINNKEYSGESWGYNILKLITRCNTPYFMFVEHDWIFVEHVNIEKLLNIFDANDNINYIKFNKRYGTGPFDFYTAYDKAVNLTRVNSFTNWPYISRKEIWIKEWIPKLIATNITTIEHNIHYDITSLREIFLKWGLYIYGKIDDRPLIKHTDGRDMYNNDDKGLSSDIIDKLISEDKIRIVKHSNEFYIYDKYSINWFITFFENWELSTFYILDHYANGGVYIDVGSWIGPTVLYSANLYKKVIALEPDPVAIKRLETNLSANKFSNIQLIKKGLADKDGKIKFGGNGELGNSESTMLISKNDYLEYDGRHTTKWKDKQNNIVEIETIRLDTLINNLKISADDINLIKIDIEGGEIIVIPAIKSFLEKYKPNLYLSLHYCYLKREDYVLILNILFDIYNVCYFFTDNGKKIKVTKIQILNLKGDSIPLVFEK